MKLTVKSHLSKKSSLLGISTNFARTNSCSWFASSIEISLWIQIVQRQLRRFWQSNQDPLIKQEKGLSTEALDTAKTPFIISNFTTSERQDCRLNWKMYFSNSMLFSLWKSSSLYKKKWADFEALVCQKKAHTFVPKDQFCWKVLSLPKSWNVLD